MRLVLLFLLMVLGVPGPAMAVKLVFVGDIMVHQDQLDSARVGDTYDFNPQFQFIAPFLSGDMVIGNFETVLRGRPPYTGYPAFNTPDSLAETLRESGFTTLLLANNHIFDRGVQGAVRTRDILQKKGFEVTGLFPPGEEARPLLVERGGMRIGIVSGTYGTNAGLRGKQLQGVILYTLDEQRLAEDVHRLREEGADIIIGAFHWGNEYQTTPNAAQRKLAAVGFELGIDLIVGTHPHVLQPMERIDAGSKTQFVAWSLGNFISCQRTVPRERSIVLSVEFKQSMLDRSWVLQSVRLLPIWVEKVRTPEGRYFITIHPALPASFAAAEGVRDEVLDEKLEQINSEILSFFDIDGLPDAEGFYTVYER